MTESLSRDIWREVALQAELPMVLARIWEYHLQRYRLHGLTVRSFSPGVDLVQTAACVPSRAEGEDFRTAPVEPREIILDWLFAGEAESGTVAALPPAIAGLIPSGMAGFLTVVPLNLAEQSVGILILQHRQDTDRGKLAELLECLQEPLAAAVVNHRHIHELSNLREKLEADNRSLLSRLDRQDISESIIGAETGLKTVSERIELVGCADVPVLLLGETGSGKEVVARALHVRSRRANGPFLRVNCGAIPPELIDSHLFGHERGSFSGAEALRKGWFERADGGTLFLDEIGDLPLQAQVRLLRVLQDGAFERVGGQRSLTVDVRIIAATHRDLRSMVAAGKFREDLWYRIAVFPIHIPPLRERQDDIPVLATHFALRAAKRLGFLPLNPDAEALRLLLAYDWPGNLRELAAVMERAVILGNGRSLDIGKALGLDAAHAARSLGVAVETGRPAGETDLQPLDRAIAGHIELALSRCFGRVEGRSGAAALLAVNPNTLRAKMRKLRIDPASFRRG